MGRSGDDKQTIFLFWPYCLFNEKIYFVGVLLSSDLQQDGPSVVDFIDMDVDPTSLPHEEEMDASPQPADNKKVIPNESDFLLGYATVFGYVSYRSKTKGSFYIKSLTENLNNFSDT